MIQLISLFLQITWKRGTYYLSNWEIFCLNDIYSRTSTNRDLSANSIYDCINSLCIPLAEMLTNQTVIKKLESFYKIPCIKLVFKTFFFAMTVVSRSFKIIYLVISFGLISKTCFQIFTFSKTVIKNACEDFC